jgi:DNA topoisomerase-3
MENVGRKMEEELREAMKGKGLGTPATRAAIIEKLIQSGYVIRQKKILVPTEKGKAIIDLAEPKLKDPELTAEWEKKLLDIEQGKYHSSQFLSEIKEFAQSTVGGIAAQDTVAFIEKEGLGNCPLCGRPVAEGKKGYGCSGWKEGCRFVVWKEIAGKKITSTQVKKLLNNGRSDLIKGFKSKSSGKSFDACLVIQDGRVAFDFPKR